MAIGKEPCLLKLSLKFSQTPIRLRSNFLQFGSA